MTRTRVSCIIGLTTLALTLAPIVADAHCDRVNGPVATDARDALASGDFSKAAIWVGEDETTELREAFEQSLPVYEQGGKAGDLAERYFMSTTVRLHRAAEGFGFTGLKPAGPVPEDIALAEKALESGNVEPVIELLSSKLESETRKWFEHAREARADRKEGLDKGREWADAYVQYVIFIHGIHEKIQEGPAHGVGE